MRPGTAVRLPNGRHLGYAEYGDPTGAPVLFLHGTPGSRMIGRVVHEQALAAGARIIAPERPGYGLSDYWHAPTVAGWCRTSAALLDGLGIERLAVLGVSGGGPYALAFGSELYERVTAASVVGGVGLVEDSAGLHGVSRLLFRTARLSERLLPFPLFLLTRELYRRPERVAARISAELARQGVDHPWGGRFLLNDFLEGLGRGTHGLAADVARLGRWDFEPESVRVPVFLWHGDRDAEIAVSAARRLAARLPACSAEYVSGEGHLGLLPRQGSRILRELLRRAPDE